MPWDELKPRQFPAFDVELDGISKQTMEDHYKLYEGYAKKANECRRILNEFDYSEIEGNQVYPHPRALSALLRHAGSSIGVAAAAVGGLWGLWHGASLDLLGRIGLANANRVAGG